MRVKFMNFNLMLAVHNYDGQESVHRSQIKLYRHVNFKSMTHVIVKYEKGPYNPLSLQLNIHAALFYGEQ